jgi:glycerol uptake facilitator-like aquaporin
MTRSRKLVAEGVGCMFLLMAVVGSGIIGEQLAAGNSALALLVNTLATGAALGVLMLVFGPVSGAHLNPAVTLADAVQGGIRWAEAPGYIAAQVAGAFTGVGLAKLMFGEPLSFTLYHTRSGAPQLLGEFIAAFGLLSVIWSCVRLRPAALPYAVGAYIAAACWFTSSTSLANPAVTLARSASGTLGGARLADVPAFIAAQVAGAAAATMLFRWLVPAAEKRAIQSPTVEAAPAFAPASTTPNPGRDSTAPNGGSPDGQIRVILVGGFLGSGKTTLLGRAARHFQGGGERVALVTNDQASNLVDTELLRRDGFVVGEVSGGCFCCKFDALVESLEKAIRANHADVVLGEPVGSCTDLSATVLQPIKHLYGDRFSLAPLTVLADPVRLREALCGAARSFPESVYYIFHKQLEEADAIVINKSDLVSGAELASLQSQLRERYPKIPVFAISAKTGAGFEAWLEFVGSGARTGQRIAEVDYDCYAEGEAMLGWLNARLQIDAAQPSNWAAFAGRLLLELRKSFQAAQAEAAHVKIFLSTNAGSVAANLAGSQAEPIVVTNLKGKPRQAGLLVNARVHLSPERLSAAIERSLQIAADEGMAARILGLSSFSPARPRPTHRYQQIM